MKAEPHVGQGGLFDKLDDLEHGGEVEAPKPSGHAAVEVLVRLYVPGRSGNYVEAESYRRHWRYRTPAVDAYLALLERTQRAAGTTILVDINGTVAEHRTKHADGSWERVVEATRNW
jgi:hypothetical protein